MGDPRLNRQRFAPVFISDLRQRFAKIPRSDFGAHQPLRPNEDLSCIFPSRERSKVSNRLTAQYSRVLK